MSGTLTAESVRAATGGRFVGRASQPRPIIGASIDTRTLSPGQLFVAIRGERTDGHAYLPQAAAAGAPLAIVEPGAEIPADLQGAMAVIEVESSRTAIVRLASVYRRSLVSTRVVAVTGSNGKTTTVRLIDALLGSGLRGSASIKSFNNELGVPLTVLNSKPTDQYLVCEVGMSTPGEIRRLASIVRPDIAVVTSIGRAHLGGLGSVESIMREKLSLLLELSPGGVGVVHDDPRIVLPNSIERAAVIRFGGSPSADLRVGEIEATSDGTSFVLNGRRRFRMPLLGAHNAGNAAAAIAVAQRFGLDDGSIAGALASARGAAMRLDRRTIAGIDVINDAYNANPDSMIAAVRGFASFAPGAARRVLVLGEMAELGPASPDLHEEVAVAIAETARGGGGPDRVVLVGPATEPMADTLRGAIGTRRVQLEPAVGDGRSIAEGLREGDAVLLKGSRSVGLERVVEAIETCRAALKP